MEEIEWEGIYWTYLFIRYLFNDAVSSSDYRLLHPMILFMMMSWKGCGSKTSWPNLRYWQ
jgi:hypothetical protein